ncbi:chorismate mutase [Dongshaea marina]|uniref:chorismate mutase n=1 Tax=Dongshaea marina TaxID=2047966 RepID=UPI001F000C39|nr:chorismate mutase [Dongshaea marina]
MKRILLLSVLFVFAPIAFAQGANMSVFQAINQRLTYMQDVALYKAQHKLPIEDSTREAVVLKKAQAQASQAGLDPQTISAFFKAQINAAKAIQYRYRAQWLSDPQSMDKQPRDLVKVVRPALITLGDQIVLKIKAHLQQKGPFTQEERSQFFQQMKVKNLSSSDKSMLYDALMQIRLKK